MARFFISTSIPYVNADPHIGFALELVQADALARYRRMTGSEVFFVTGTDENALKNVQAAEKAGQPVADFVAQHTSRFFELGKILGISNDDFIRTTEERHIKGAQKLWQACAAAGDIYKKHYSGLYCIGCEAFITAKELVDGLCPEHKTAPQEIEEENYFFRLSKYQERLQKLLESDTLRILPSSRKNEMLAFISQGLEDFSISRSQERAKHWGIEVPGDPSQVMYVWFDALTNYINAMGYGSDEETKFSAFWQGDDETAHLVGKGITRFHAIYWPAMLLSSDLRPPTTVFVHGYINFDGEKMSKSLGNVINPFDALERFGAETVRYYLLREIPSTDDSDFSWENVENRYNGDLANGLGNLVQRTATLIETKLGGTLTLNREAVIAYAGQSYAGLFHDTDYAKGFAQFRLHEAAAEVWKKIGLANAFINDREPWHQSGDAQRATLEVAAAMILHIAWLLQPLMPLTADRIFSLLGTTAQRHTDDGLKIVVGKVEPLFPRRQK